jgi:Type II secretion system (T2SS), protein M subtype b
MTKREKNILALALLTGVVFAFTQVLPAARAWQADGAARVEQLQSEIAREQRLQESAADWAERRAGVEARGLDLEARLFQETSIPLISASIQRLVRDLASQNGISITSTKLAEAMETDGWLLVEQELSLLTDNQQNLLQLLRSLDTATPWLGVSSFSIRRNRNQYAGTLTVVGFSQTESPRAGSAE